MKNDVVRWNVADHSPQTTRSENDSDAPHDVSDRSKNSVSPKRWQRQRQRNAAVATHTRTTSTRAVAAGGGHRGAHAFETAIKCDNHQEALVFNRSLNSSIVHDRRRSTTTTKTIASVACASPSIRSRHLRKQCAFSPSSIPLSYRVARSRTLNWSACLLVCVQFGLVVFLCNTSVGFGFASAAHTPVVFNEVRNELAPSVNDVDARDHYTQTWAVHIPQGETGVADQVAHDHGFVNLGKIFDDHYHFAHHKVSKRSTAPAASHQSRLEIDHRVHWAKQQKAKLRRKRDFIRMRPSRTSSRALSLVDVVPFSDPKWSQMWYLNRGGGLDMNVIPAWQEGITGKGIVVTILDDGLESDHPDIEHNYDPKASYDVNSHDNDPMPHYDMTDSNRHGTRCAGEVAATANNSICAVGIAFGASVGGVRMLDGDVTDAVEARSLSLNPQHIDIYSASWGPDDDGKTVDGPGELASRAFIEGVTKGRNGKGSIFIWASGNGGRELDNCNCDGYTNSIWTLSISSATEEGHVPWYSEKCSSTLATTYSSGGQSEKQVVTTDLHHSCTVSHTGTSASAPLAAGIAALVLESNQNLTWRDLQHIVVRTAKPANLKDPTWSLNGIGRRISHSFGYGLMDAAAMVRSARTWKTVPEQQRCEINAPHVDKAIPARSYITLQLTVKHCLSVNYLEHVQAKITLTSQRRGDIQLYLKSPAGTKVTLLTSRVHDVSRSGFNQWPFMSVHTWGESPHGNWQLEIHNEGRYMGHALLREWSLIFYGTTLPIDPSDPMSTPRATSAENSSSTTPNSSSSATSTTTNLHQIYSPLYPRISSPNNFGTGVTGLGGGLSAKLPPGKMPPNKSVYVAGSGSANYPLAGAGRKQQQLLLQPPQQTYQQISATYGVILGSQSKHNNNNNANGNNNNNGNSNGKGQKSKGKIGENVNKGNKNSGGAGAGGVGAGAGGVKGTSNKKDQQSPATNGKNKFYRISQQQQQQSNTNKAKQNGGTAQQRTKASHSSAEKMHSYEEKMLAGNRKIVVGDLPSSASAAVYTKLPVKATKQVKESAAPPATVSLPMSVQTHERMQVAPASDQRIPKLFERYEKIQAIFPEFQPYQGPREKEATIASGALSGVAASTSDTGGDSNDDKRKQLQNYETETLRPIISGNIGAAGIGGGGGGSKPSRENSKKSSPSFIPDQKIIKKQQLLLAAAGVSGGTQRPMSVGVPPNWKSTNAQITQWDLIFYGTETPAQPDDPAPSNRDQFSPFGNDMEHNDIEYDASGQWRNMQQVGESSVTANDRTNTSCLKATFDQKCLACAPPTYHFNGHCYDVCPTHTYAIVSNATKSAGTADSNKLTALDVEPGEELQSKDRRRRDDDRNQTAVEVETEDLLTAAGRWCAICDRSCLQCYGPQNSQCSTCYAGSQLRRHTNETYCYVFAERSSGNSRDSGGGGGNLTTTTASAGALLLKIVIPILVVVVAITLWTTSGRKLCCRCTGSNAANQSYAYDRVALLPNGDLEPDVTILARHIDADGPLVEWKDETETETATVHNDVASLSSSSDDDEVAIFNASTFRT